MSAGRLPARLRPGATIGVIAPASPPSVPVKIDRGIAYLEQQGFHVIRGESLYKRDGYLAGTDAERAADLNAMFENDAVDAIFCARGGYGTARILPLIDYDLASRRPKILVGYSDITALSMSLVRNSGLVTFAGPMVAADMATDMPATTERWFWDMLMNEVPRITIAAATDRRQLGTHATASGMLIGGTLSILTTLVGTPFEPRWKGSLLFIEDVGENVYKIDRMLMHLTNAGVLSQAAGVILGSFVSVPDEEVNRVLHDVFAEYLGSLDIPVLTGFPFGHTPVKCTLPFGAEATIDALTGTLSFNMDSVFIAGST